MAGVIDLAAWRKGHREGGVDEARLEGAVERLDRLIAAQRWSQPPPWLVTELLAIQGCISMGLTGEAAFRAERLIARTERMLERFRGSQAR
jgi:hypothetical protein